MNVQPAGRLPCRVASLRVNQVRETGRALSSRPASTRFVTASMARAISSRLNPAREQDTRRRPRGAALTSLPVFWRRGMHEAGPVLRLLLKPFVEAGFLRESNPLQIDYKSIALPMS